MKFIAMGDIEDEENMNALLKLNLEKYDFLVLTGDISGSPDGWKIGKARAMKDKNFIPANKDPKEYYDELLEPNVKKLRKIDTALGKIRKRIKIYAVYGNTDFKRVVKKAKPKNLVLLHNNCVEHNGLFLIGYNGHPMYTWELNNPSAKDIFGYTNKETMDDINSFREEKIYMDLKELAKNKPNNRVIIVTHTPPYKILDKVNPEFVSWAKRSYGKSAADGNVGSTGLRKFNLEYKPLLSVFGHIHESKGIDTIGKTTFVNTGSFDKNLDCSEIEIHENGVIANFISLKN